MSKKNIYAVISRYLTKTTIVDDEEKLNCWVDESEENKSLFEKIEDHWNAPSLSKISILNSEEIKKDIWDRANQQPSYKVGSPKKSNINYLLRYAAVLLILFSSIPIIYFQLNKDTGATEQSTVQLISKYNNAGRKSTIHLKDGTTVNLNAESKISYNETFSDTARFIWLTGEAFFDVAHDDTKPFYVISQNVKVEALGTAFNVSGYPDFDVVKVSVNGYDSISNEINSKEIILLPGQEISFEKSANTFSPVTTYNAVEVEGWKDGTLYFKHAGLKEIISKLKKWYGVEIQIGSVPTKEISYTGIFKKQNLNNVLSSIGFVNNFDFRINDKNVMLNFKDK